MEEFLKDRTDVVLIFKEVYRMPASIFARGVDVMRVLQDVGNGRPRQECYLADSHADYLMFFFHEGTLYTGGTAAEWLKGKLNEIYDYIGAPPQPLLLIDIHPRSFGREIALECAYNPQSPQPLHLIFKICLNIQWQPSLSPSREPRVDFVFLGTEAWRGIFDTMHRHATIRTTECVINLDFEELVVEKDW